MNDYDYDEFENLDDEGWGTAILAALGLVGCVVLLLAICGMA